ncbi:hypothetical protein [Amycolatopsis sp. GM8]|nr:hypothetical protein [Amycolatopsis sp. GM8]
MLIAAVAVSASLPPAPVAILVIPVFMFAMGLWIAAVGAQAGRKDRAE